MDVICCGMYRACSTWQYEVVGHLIEWRRKGLRLGYVEGHGYDPGPGRGAVPRVEVPRQAPELLPGHRRRRRAWPSIPTATSATWSTRCGTRPAGRSRP